MKCYTPEYSLTKYIKSYCVIRGNNSFINCRKTFLPYNEACIAFLVADNKITFSNKKNKTGIYLCPPRLESHDVDLKDDFFYVDVTFYPGVLYEKFKIPFNHFENESYDINDLSIRMDKNILELLYINRKDEEQIVDILNNFFFKFFYNFEESQFLLRLRNLYDNCTLKEFYDNLGLSKRQTQRNIYKYTGLTPGSILRISRFHKLIKNIENTTNRAHFCQELNFYDQSHMIKEFKFFTGVNLNSFFNNSSKYLY
jgi:AraC-like DNA-binding protein